MNLVLGHCLVDSLTGAVASQKVTEALKGSLRTDGNRSQSAKAEGSLTARATTRADRKLGLSDPAVASGSAVAQRIKATLGITGLSPPKRYASWVQNVVRQFGPYPSRAEET